MSGLSGILSFFGVAFILIGYIWTVATLFSQDGIIMGLLGLAIPMVCFYAAIRHCVDRKGPSLTLLSGAILFIASVMTRA